MEGVVQSIGNLGLACLDHFLFQGLDSISEMEVSVCVAGTQCALLLLHKPDPLLVFT